MKRLCFVFIIFSLFVSVSCGSSKGGEPAGPTEPTDPTDEPTNPTEDPTEPTDEPTNPTDEPTEPEEPTDPDDDPAKPQCTELYTIEGAERYFAFKGTGRINQKDAIYNQSSETEAATAVETDFAGIPGANFQYAEELSFFENGYAPLAESEAVTLTVIGDAFSGTDGQNHITTMATVVTPIDWLKSMKDNGNYELDQAPITEIIVLKWSKNARFVQECVYFGKTYDNGYTFNGKMTVCHDKNNNFGVGETFQFSMISEIGSDEETAAVFDMESTEDLCTCFDLDIQETEQQIECADVNWEEKIECAEEDHKELNAAGDACVCMTGYIENAETHECNLPPECSISSGSPCRDSANSLTWSAKSPESMSWQNAVDYCENLTEIGYDDWYLPDINELRTLIQNCPATETGGSCLISDPDHLSDSDLSDACNGCPEYSGSCHSRLGDTDWLWSYSMPLYLPGLAWRVNFRNGHIGYNSKSDSFYVRCVR